MWLWLLSILGLLATLIGLVAILGARMNPKHVASRSLVLQQAPTAVWQAITDYAAQPTWRKHLKEVVLVDEAGGQPIWKEVPRRDSPLPLQTMESDPPRRLVRRIADPGLPFGGRWVYELTPTPKGCRLTITEEGEIYNPIFRFVGHNFINLAATIEAFLKDLNQHFGGTGTLETSVPSVDAALH